MATNLTPFTSRERLHQASCLCCGCRGIDYLGAEVLAAGATPAPDAEVEHHFECPDCGFAWSECFLWQDYAQAA